MRNATLLNYSEMLKNELESGKLGNCGLRSAQTSTRARTAKGRVVVYLPSFEQVRGLSTICLLYG